MGLPFAKLVSNNTPGASYDFKENERLRLIIIKIGHHWEYEKMKRLEAEKEASLALAFGEQVSQLDASFKLGGISIEAVVIGRSNEPFAPVIQNFVTPSTPVEQLIRVRFDMPTPEVIFKKNAWQYQQGIDAEKVKNGFPFTTNMFPKISPTTVKIDGQNVKFEDLTEAQKTGTVEGQTAAANETKRLAEWNAVMSFFQSVPESNAAQYMRHLMAAWAGIVHRNDMGDFSLVEPTVGTIWDVGVNGPSYVRPVPFKYVAEKKSTEWNVGLTVSQNEAQAIKLLEKLDAYSATQEHEESAW